MIDPRDSRRGRHLAHAAFAAALLAGLPVSAAVYNWDNVTGNWSTSSNWAGDAAPTSNLDNELVFGGSDPGYIATHDLDFGFFVNSLRLNSSVLTATQTLNASGISTLDLIHNGVNAPAITQSGAGGFVIDIPINISSDTNLNGTGSGLVSFHGPINGFGSLLINGGNWMFSDVTSSYSGVTTISGGANVEVRAEGGGNQNVQLAAGAGGLLGMGDTIALDGGSLKLTTQGTGTLQLGNNRTISGGLGGGTLDLTNGNPDGTGGHITSGDLAIITADGATSPLVIKFNGGQVGMSNAGTLNGDWQMGGNALRLRSLAGTGPLRIDLTNGAALRAGGPAATMPFTVRGVLGGDPTSGPDATNQSSISRTTGRLGVDASNVATYSAGLFLEGAMQVAVTGNTRAIDGNVTVAGSAGGAAGYVTFSGRSTGTSLANGTAGSVINNPGVSSAGQNPLWLGQGRDDLLTIQDGAIAVMDLRVRSEQGSHNGVLLDANTQIDAGGVLRFAQSLSNANASQGGVSGANTTASVGNHIVRGDIRGSGSTGKEAVMQLYLPAGNVIPASISTNSPIATGGVVFDTTAGSNAALVVNGSGFGGLKVEAIARPAALFPTRIDPVSNSAKLDNLLTPERISGLTGTGGYLTVAATNELYTLPFAEWAPTVSVGLKVVNSNPAGADLQLATGTWGHNLAVDAGAELISFGDLTLATGTLHGTGSVNAAGSLNIATTASVSPGFNDIGRLNVGNISLSGAMIADIGDTSSDVLNVAGSLSFLPTSALSISTSGPSNNNSHTLLRYTGTLTGTIGTVNGLPSGYAISYSTPGEVRLVYTQFSTLTWNGAPGVVWSTSGSASNWQGNASFTNGDMVTFDDSATNTTLNLSGIVHPGGITFNNSGKSYVINAPTAGDSISGTGILTKNGTGAVTLNGSHNYGGGTVINAGTITLGNDNALSDVAPVTVANGATLNVNNRSDAVGELSVAGTVTAGNLSVASLILQDGAAASSNFVLNGDVTKNGTSGVILPGSIDLNGAPRTFTVASGAAADLDISGVISNGQLVKAGPGVLRLSAVNTYDEGTILNGGTILAGVAGAIPDGAITISDGVLDSGSFNLTATSLNGVGGILSMGAGTLTLDLASEGTFAGAIFGTGPVVKQGTGTQTLNGGSDFSGGLTINAGRVNVTSATGGGTGLITVNGGGGLQLGATIPNNVRINGGTISGSSGANLGTGEWEVVENSNVITSNRTTNGTSDVVFHGTLRGAGNLLLSPAPTGNADSGPGFRLRGTTSSDYSGTVTAQQRAKFEIQMSNSASPNPFGNGRIIMTAGTSTGGLNGTYSQLQPRMSAGGETYLYGNDVQIAGTGFMNVNALGGSDVTAMFGELRIGAGQILSANKNDQTNRTVAFESVLLDGTAEFRPWDPAFGVQTNAARGGSNIQLGNISESAPGSGIIFRGAPTSAGGSLAINEVAGIAGYTGRTQVPTGVLRIGISGSLASSSEIELGDDSILDVLLHFTGYNIPSAQRLSGSGDWDGHIVASGTLAPGVGGIGTLTGDDLTLNGNAPLKFELSTFDNTSDRISLLGAFTKGTGGTFTFDFLGTGAIFQTYTLIEYGTNTFTASDFSATNLAPGLTGTFQMTPTALEFVVVPEPASAAALLAGTGLLLCRRRRTARS